VTARGQRRARARDPLAGIPAELRAKMSDAAWRKLYNEPLSPARALLVMPPEDVLRLMLDRWLRLPASERVAAVDGLRAFAPTRVHKALDVLEALEAIIRTGVTP